MKRTPGRIAGFALKHLFKKPATIAYPFGKLKIEPNYRGKIVYDAANCIGCNLCVRDCPTGAIQIVNAGTKENKVMECHMDYARCIFCAQCVDSCKKDCLHFSPDIELAGFDKKAMKVALK